MRCTVVYNQVCTFLVSGACNKFQCETAAREASLSDMCDLPCGKQKVVQLNEYRPLMRVAGMLVLLCVF
jgi:hypothetical protein